MCLAFVETLQRENIVSDARHAAQTIQASTARVILIFTWYTDVRELFLQLAKANVRKIKLTIKAGHRETHRFKIMFSLCCVAPLVGD